MTASDDSVVDTLQRTIKHLEETGEMTQSYVRLRQALRQLLYEHGVPSNPGWDDSDIVDALRSLLRIKETAPKGERRK